MANWGVPDFDSRTESQRAIDAGAEDLRRHLAAQGKTTEFAHNDKVERGYNQALVQIWCVRHAEWQRLRLHMKGKTTSQKLDLLHQWWDKYYGQQKLEKSGIDVCAIQVGNYLGALRRGGQLDDMNRIRKEVG